MGRKTEFKMKKKKTSVSFPINKGELRKSKDLFPWQLINSASSNHPTAAHDLQAPSSLPWPEWVRTSRQVGRMCFKPDHSAHMLLRPGGAKLHEKLKADPEREPWDGMIRV